MKLKGFKKSDGSIAKIYTDPTLTESDSPADAASVKAKDDLLQQGITNNANYAAGLNTRLSELENGAPSIIAPKVTEWLDANVDPTGSAVTVDSSLTIAGSAADAKKTGDELSNLKSDLKNLTDFCKKEVTIDFSKTENVVVGQYSHSAKLLDVDIPSGQEYTIKISTTATHGNITVYENHADGTSKALSYNAQVDTDLTFTAEKQVKYFAIYIVNGFTSTGSLTFIAKYSYFTTNSLEERIDTLSESVNSAVNLNEMDQFGYELLPASANRYNPQTLVQGKEYNWAYGTIRDNADNCYFFIDVSPNDTVYFWRLHNGDIITLSATSIGVFDENGNFIRQGGIGSYSTSYTVPSNVHKLVVNAFLSHALIDDIIVIINNSSKPSKSDANNYFESGYRYFDSNKSMKNIDFNSLVPLSCKTVFDETIISVGHAGGLSEYYPLNTELSIIGAKMAGITCVEMDVQITSDGVYVLYHDTDMRRVGGTQQQTIGNMTYQQLQQFDYGSWKDAKFINTPICTLERAVQLCKLLNMSIILDCKTLQTVSDFEGAAEIINEWEMSERTYWATGMFANCWEAVPNAKIIFGAGSKLVGSKWDDPNDGWFNGITDNFPNKTTVRDGVRVFNDDVFFGVINDYTLMNESGYGVNGLKQESIVAKKYNIKYGLYAVDDVETIYTLTSNIPYMQYMESNSISIQNALNQHFGITKANYLY